MNTSRLSFFLLCIITLGLNQFAKAQEKFNTKALTNPKKFGDEFKSLFKLKEVYEFTKDSSASGLYLHNGLRSYTYKNTEEWLDIKNEVIVTGVSIVFSKYPLVNGLYPGFHDLLCNRLKTLFELDPKLNSNKINWEMVLQTHCDNDSQVASLFHGAVIWYKEKDDTSSTRVITEIDKSVSTPFAANKGDIESVVSEFEKLNDFPAELKNELMNKKNEDKAETLISYFESELISDTTSGKNIHTDAFITKNKTKIEAFIKQYYWQQQDTVISCVFDRNPQWKKSLVVADWTGSMYGYGAQALLWHIKHLSKSEIYYFTLFNDGDNKIQANKIIGKTGGIYHSKADNIERVFQLYNLVSLKGGGGDGPENDLEAVLDGIKTYPDHKDIVLIVDNNACIRDMELLSEIKEPLHVIVCGYRPEWGVNPQLIEIVTKTKGTLHTIEFDLTHTMLEEKLFNPKTKLQYNLVISRMPCFGLNDAYIFSTGKLVINPQIFTDLEIARKQVSKVHQLDLSSRELTKIPKSVFKLDVLINFKINNNLLTEIPNKIEDLTQLRQLSACCNKIATITPNISKLRFIQYIDLSNNNIDTLCDDLFNFQYLTYLNLTGNRIRFLPQRLSCRKLEYLYLAQNYLQVMPTYLSSLRKLKELVLADNSLSKLPKSIGSLVNLEILDLSNNNITSLPNTITRLTKLKALKLTGNPISEAEKNNIKSWLPNTVIEF